LQTAGQILDATYVLYHIGNVSMFKVFIFTVVKNFAWNKGMRGPDLP